MIYNSATFEYAREIQAQCTIMKCNVRCKNAQSWLLQCGFFREQNHVRDSALCDVLARSVSFSGQDVGMPALGVSA